MARHLTPNLMIWKASWMNLLVENLNLNNLEHGQLSLGASLYIGVAFNNISNTTLLFEVVLFAESFQRIVTRSVISPLLWILIGNDVLVSLDKETILVPSFCPTTLCETIQIELSTLSTGTIKGAFIKSHTKRNWFF